jgi:ADP-heptose:LPS heptosyltransferase
LNHRRIDYLRKIKLSFANTLFSKFSKSSDLNESNAILVLRLDGKLGDSVTATGFLRELKKNNINSKLIVATSESTENLYKSLDFIDEVFVSKKGVLNTMSLFLKLKTYNYKFIINTSHILNPRVLFLASFLKAFKKVGLGHEKNKIFNHSVAIDFVTEHVTERYRHILKSLGLAADNLDYQIEFKPESIKAAVDFIENLRKKQNVVIALNSFAGARLRNLSQKTTVDIVRKILKNPHVIVISLANAGDHRILNSWIDQSFGGRWVHNPDLCSLDDNIALLQNCDLIVTPDTAWVHIASALKKKLVAIYREDNNANEVNSVIWAPYKNVSRVLFAQLTSANPDDINNVDTDVVVQNVFQLLDL